jgi:uncharacterized protein with von Willebrand factor type A (vWA) domain
MTQHMESVRFATVVAVDCSWTTEPRVAFEVIRESAVTLDALLKSDFPDDILYTVKFSAYAEQITREQLSSLSWDEFILGTNIHHALLIGKDLLEPHTNMNRIIIVVTDGEPTAHLDRGRSYFAYPPSRDTFRETARILRECVHSGISVDIYAVDPRPFAASALMWDLGADPLVARKARILPSSPGEIRQDIIERYVLRHRGLFH